MAGTTRIAVSQILRSKDDAPEDIQEEEPKKKSREDWRKAKELEEARKAGTAPAAVDEEGKFIVFYYVLQFRILQNYIILLQGKI